MTFTFRTLTKTCAWRRQLALRRSACGLIAALNGNIYTADEKNPRAEAVLAVDGRITFVGSKAEAEKRAPQDVKRLDLAGLTVFPGLTDGHAHLEGIGERETSFNVEGVKSVAELKERLRAEAAQRQARRMAFRERLDRIALDAARFPYEADLDAVVADRPVVL